MVMPEKKESEYAQRKRRKAELEALSDDELGEEIEKASPGRRRLALKLAVGWLRGTSSYGTYVGNNGTNRAIPHGLGRQPTGLGFKSVEAR